MKEIVNNPATDRQIGFLIRRADSFLAIRADAG